MRLRCVAMAACAAAVIGCDAQTQRQIQGKPTVPVPVLVDRNTENPFFFGNGKLHALVRNTGAQGYVTVSAQQGDRIVSRETYLNEGETREVIVDLEGFVKGNYDIIVRPGRERD